MKLICWLKDRPVASALLVAMGMFAGLMASPSHFDAPSTAVFAIGLGTIVGFVSSRH